MSIELETINSVTETARKMLQKKALGGVTTDSAYRAINKAVVDLANVSNIELKKVEMRLTSAQSHSQKAIQDITAAKDRVEFYLDRAKEEKDTALQKLQETTEKLNSVLKTKTGKAKVLPNGNIEATKVNKNGARMTVEYLPNDARTPIAYKVEDVDGYVRKTKLNPVTGKPIQTYTDTNGGHKYEYLPNGVKITRVNAKKAKTSKPTVISKQVISENRDYAVIQRNFSDGTYEVAEFNKERGIIYKGKIFNSDKKLIYEYKNVTTGSTKIHKEFFLNPEDGRMTKSIENTDLGDGKFKKFTAYYDTADMGYLKTESINEHGMKKVVKAKVDAEFGFVDKNHPDVIYTYPKESPIKTARYGFGKDFSVGKEILKMKDGSTVELKINDNWYQCGEVKIISKTGEERIIPKTEAKEYLESIGYEKNCDGDYISPKFR